MANTNSNLVTLLAAAATDQTAPLKGLSTGALLLYIRGEVTCPATPTANDTLTLVPAALIPIGAKLAPEFSWVYCETDPGTALTLDIGMASNADALADALALTTAATTGGKVGFDVSGTMPLGISDPITVSTPEDIYATVTVTTAVDATVIQFCIAYYATA
jgi:hypothetical protein